jgi:hypothetical protein
MHGKGTYTFPDGKKYVGGFKDNKYHGQGTLTFPNGDKCVGEWKNDILNGIATKYRGEGSIYQYGTYKDDVLVE